MLFNFSIKYMSWLHINITSYSEKFSEQAQFTSQNSSKQIWMNWYFSQKFLVFYKRHKMW